MPWLGLSIVARTHFVGTVARRHAYSSNRNFKIAFNPLYEGEDTPFAVLTPVIEKDSRWISDIAEFFAPDFDSCSFVKGLSRSLCKSHFSYRYLSILGRTASSHRSWLRTWDQPA